VTPGTVIRPGTGAEVAAALKHASDARQSLVIRGAGTKEGYGRPASRIDVILDMQRLNHILAHEHGDMTATIEAGASLRLVNVALMLHGQMLPLDPPFADRATIGGLLATNDSGPLRHRFGTPRDLVIGVQLATTDGTLAKAGGQVVKNVAGYDLSKLITGSFGSLAAIVSATFKLAPRPAASTTLRMGMRDTDALADAVHTVMASQLEPIAFEVRADSAPNVVQAPRPALGSVLVRDLTTIGVALVALLGTPGIVGRAHAQSPLDRSLQIRKAQSPADGEIHVLAVQGNVYMLAGAGGNIAVQIGDEGVLVVDTGIAQMSDKILAAIRTLSDKPIRYIVNTHAHADHTGGNEALSKAGKTTRGEVADIIAHENVLNRMSGASGRLSQLLVRLGKCQASQKVIVRIRCRTIRSRAVSLR
jgi:FAD/FMN-containing dehydrogenase